jgi:N-acetyl-S-(2-succino)cysteine monooxygenase
MMNLLCFANLVGTHVAAWRHPKSYSKLVDNLDGRIELAKIAERGMLDAMFIADGNGVNFMNKRKLLEANIPGTTSAEFEPVTLLAAISQHTKHLGLVATATTTYEPPWIIARKFASLDMISGGRGGWNAVTSSYVGDAFNFGRTEHPPREERYERAKECVEVVTGLWDSWAGDAFPQNKATGQYLDSTKVRPLDHKGKYFHVSGPLSVPRSKQGRPVQFSAGQSEQGKELAAQYSDGVFGTALTKEIAMRDYADIKGRMAKYGRAPESLRFLPGLVCYIGKTISEAEEYFQEVQSLLDPEIGKLYLWRSLGIDLDGYSVDDLMPEVKGEMLGGYSNREQMGGVAKRERLTIRQTYERMCPGAGTKVIVGTPSQIADLMEDWHLSQACDGFVLSGGVSPKDLTDISDLLVPELQRRGLFREKYVGTTLRENMGLPIPLRRPDRDGSKFAK